MHIEIVNRTIDTDRVQISLLESAFRKFASTVAGSVIDVTLVTKDMGHYRYAAPAWSDASRIWVKVEQSDAGDIELPELLRIKGLIIHELGHILFTPRDRSGVAKQIHSLRLWESFNILEDNRIDNMMVGRLSGVQPWLTHTIIEELFKDGDITYVLPLVWGRKYIPAEMRQAAVDAFGVPEHVPAIQQIIDEYITLNMSRKQHQERAVALVIELNNLRGQVATETETRQPDTQHQHASSLPEKNLGDDMRGIREQDAALEGSRQAFDRQAQQEQAKSKSQDSDSSDNDVANSGKPLSREELNKIVEEQAKAAAQAMLQDVKDMVRGMRNSSGNGTSGGTGDKRVKPVESSWDRKVRPEATMISKGFARQLTELKALYDPGWLANQSQGRLNAGQFLMGAELDESFDLWDDSMSHATEIEAVILLDISGSMSSMYTPAFEAMWGIKRALDYVAADTTVVTYGEYSRVLYKANERASVDMRWNIDGGGGTDPLEGMRFARDVLLNSNKAVKLCITITDGAWDNSQQCDWFIAEMRQADVLTSLVYLADDWLATRAKEAQEKGQEPFRIDGHKCELVSVITKPHDIITLAKDMVSMQQRKMLFATQ